MYVTAALLAVPIAQALGLGEIIGYLAAGLAIGPWGVGLGSNGGRTSCTLPSLAGAHVLGWGLNDSPTACGRCDAPFL